MQLTYDQHTYNLSQPIDLAIPLEASSNNLVAWYLEAPVIEPVRFGDWVGKVSEGSSTNFNNILFNPHGHGTHTECLGHITRDFYSVHQAFKRFFFSAYLISILPTSVGDDAIIMWEQLAEQLESNPSEAVVIRTLPNKISKKSQQYSHTNPPYLEAKAAAEMARLGVQHLLIDLPSVDREEDGGALAAHKAFWNVQDIHQLNADARHQATITELIYVPDEVKDGRYLLNLQVAAFVNDAAPSRPVLYGVL